MNHAVSPVLIDTARHVCGLDADHDNAIKTERVAEACERILDTFDAKDVMTAIDVVAELAPARLQAFHEALSIIPQLQSWKLEDPRFRAIAQAFDSIANYYAGYTAGREVHG